MVERNLIIDQLKLTYEGVFDLNGMYRTIDRWFYSKGYDKYEKKNFEQVLPGGRDIDVELMPWKKITDYFKNVLRIRLRAVNVKDVEIQKEGAKLRVQQGKIMMIFDAYLDSDYENYWAGKPAFFFLKTIFEKYVFTRYRNQAEKWLVNDLYQLHGKIQQFLNLYRYEKRL